MSEKRIKLIQDGLQSLNPLKIDIIDEGHLHVGHAGKIEKIKKELATFFE